MGRPKRGRMAESASVRKIVEDFGAKAGPKAGASVRVLPTSVPKGPSAGQLSKANARLIIERFEAKSGPKADLGLEYPKPSQSAATRLPVAMRLLDGLNIERIPSVAFLGVRRAKGAPVDSDSSAGPHEFSFLSAIHERPSNKVRKAVNRFRSRRGARSLRGES